MMVNKQEPKHETFPDQDTAFPCPRTRNPFAPGCKVTDGIPVNIKHVCWEQCSFSDYTYDTKDGLPVAYCPLDCMGERELVSGKITRDN